MSRRSRILVAALIALPLLVAGAAAVLVAHALAGSWLWGLVWLTVAVTLFALAFIAFARYARKHPEAADVLVRADARAQSGFPVSRSSD